MINPVEILAFVVYGVIGVGIMLLLTHLCGEVSGLKVTLLLVIMQCAVLFSRVLSLERRLQTAKQAPASKCSK